MDSEVLEGAEEAALEGFPQPQLGGDAPVEPLDDAFAVGALGGRGEPEQLLRSQVVEEPPVRRGLGVMELVHDDDVEAVGWQGEKGA